MVCPGTEPADWRDDPCHRVRALRGRLESELAEVDRDLLAGQEVDFRNLIAQRFANRSEGDFPLVEWLAVADQVRQRGYRFASTDQELLNKTEAVYRELTDEPRDWKRAESSGKADLYVTFAHRYPESPRAKLARERASEMLGQQLRQTPCEGTVRTQYLNVRSEVHKARDRRGSDLYRPWVLVALLVAMGVAVGCSVVAPFFRNNWENFEFGYMTTSVLCSCVIFTVVWRATFSESKCPECSIRSRKGRVTGSDSSSSRGFFPFTSGPNWLLVRDLVRCSCPAFGLVGPSFGLFLFLGSNLAVDAIGRSRRPDTSFHLDDTLLLGRRALLRMSPDPQMAQGGRSHADARGTYRCLRLYVPRWLRTH